ALTEGHRVAEVAHAHTEASNLVRETGPDTAAGRADGGSAAHLLVQLIDQGVVGHHDVRPIADREAFGADATRFQRLYLLQQRSRVDRHAIADDAGLIWVENAGRHDMKGEEPE